MRINKEMCCEAVNVLQEIQIDELDILLGGGKGHGVNTISADVVGTVYKPFLHVVSRGRIVV